SAVASAVAARAPPPTTASVPTPEPPPAGHTKGPAPYRGPGPSSCPRGLGIRRRRTRHLPGDRHHRQLLVDAHPERLRRPLLARAAHELLHQVLDAELGQARRAVRHVRAHALLVLRGHLRVEVLVEVLEHVVALGLPRRVVRDGFDVVHCAPPGAWLTSPRWAA